MTRHPLAEPGWLDGRTFETAVHGLSTSPTDSHLFDATLGGLAGYAIAPAAHRLQYAALGAAGVGLFGALGLVGLGAWYLFRRGG